MYVITRSGEKEPIKFDKITERIEQLCFDLDRSFIDPMKIAKKVIEGIYDGITTKELDQLAAETAAYLSTQHPQYATLAGRIAVSNLHKETRGCFSENIKSNVPLS
jgi:ribonucleoside-diphosphate reductase alpha chain